MPPFESFVGGKANYEPLPMSSPTGPHTRAALDCDLIVSRGAHKVAPLMLQLAGMAASKKPALVVDLNRPGFTGG